MIDIVLLVGIVCFAIGFGFARRLYLRYGYIYRDVNSGKLVIRYLDSAPKNYKPIEENETIISELSPDDFNYYESLIEHKNKILEKKFKEFVHDIEHAGVL